jgi:enoyl-CoA hydratase/carnithine racemase
MAWQLSSNSGLQTEVDGTGVLTITLPDAALGGFSRRDLRDLTWILEQAACDDDLRVIVLEGTNVGFCVGLALEEFVDEDGLDELSDALKACFNALADNPLPLLAAVEGRAIGFGLSLLVHSDFVAIRPGSRLEAPFLSLGVLPEAGSTQILPERIGYLNAFKLFCVGEGLDAEAAQELGLVSEVTETPKKLVRKQAKRLAGRPLGLMRSTRQMLKSSQQGIQKRIELEILASHERLRSASVRDRLARLASRMVKQARRAVA